MDVEERIEDGTTRGDGRDLAGVYRYYELAKRAEWQVKDLPWGELPRPPSTRARRRSSRDAKTSGAR